MTDWDEVKRLAADFQKVQLSSTTQKLSERNCIEIVSWLIQKKMLDLIFTSDGKEYMTPSQLVSDIKGELYVSGGRVNLVDVAKAIGVDLVHVNTYVSEVTHSMKDVTCIMGQLIDASYVTRIAGEINEKLSQQGQININELTLHYDLPSDFLQNTVVEKNLGKLIFGRQDRNDPRLYFTESFVASAKAKIRGALYGLTKPTSATVIANNADVSEDLFFTLFDSNLGSLTSKQAGAQYVPHIHSRSQNEWVQSFYKQNGYLEFDSLTRLGVVDNKAFLAKANLGEVIHLNTCVVSKSILQRLEGDIDEMINSKSYLDLPANLPTVFNDQDIKMIVDKVLSASKQKETVVVEGFILSKAFIDSLAKDCETVLSDKVKSVVESGKYQQYQTDLQVKNNPRSEVEEVKVDKREERRKKAAGGNKGGGTQGRETKTKSTKKGGAKARVISESDEGEVEKKSLDILSVDEISNVIRVVLEAEGLDELVDPLGQYLHPILNEKGLQQASQLYATTVADRTANRRQTHNEIQTKLNNLVGDVRLFEKGIKLLPVDSQPQFHKYLLKSLCTDFVSEILNYISSEEGTNVCTDNFNNDQRLKFINDLSADYKVPLTALIKTLSAATIDDWMEGVDAALSSCSMVLKKVDKKKDRVQVLNHKHALLEQLEKCEDYALALHLATLIIFISATQCMIHASGRHVSNLLVFLKQFLSSEQIVELTTYHDMVTMLLSGGSDIETAKERLAEKMPTIKQIANEYKKSGANSEKS
ncbi:PREDICTED: E3 UFM1-protein ligase 1 homolog [Nicrophorus vespilloides]|uniref:E3 UFM1-protein ligase 1 homolog n=1 Tax=Nicrophorus vespilloides TaxID=110193 RepID=A0ABM1MHV5_NICVS|nr:PREDICTED: E3 UFM1-protein ligase 1 homolog [Nicrophorus vespilloides]